MNGEIQNACNLYITHIVTIVPRQSFAKETNDSESIEQRKNSSAEETSKTVYYQYKDSRKNLKTDWLKLYRTQRRTKKPVEHPR